MVTLKVPANVQKHDRSSINSAKIKTTVAGATASGKTAHVLDIKSAASHAGTAIKTRQQTTVLMKKSRRHVNAAVHHRTVMNFFSILNVVRSFSYPNLGSCKSIQHYKRTRSDGEHRINIRGREVEVYCHNMDTDNPVEYVTLRKGSHENYALFYSKRSSDMSICENGKGIHDESIHHGTTRFNKVRININTLQIVDNDYEFSHTVGRPQKFATGGDCYSNSGSCPQGDFFVNLEGTGFRIRPSLAWEASGTNSTIEYQIRVGEASVN